MADGQAKQEQSTITYESRDVGRVGDGPRHVFTDDQGNTLEIHQRLSYEKDPFGLNTGIFIDNVPLPTGSEFSHAKAICPDDSKATDLSGDVIPEYSMEELKKPGASPPDVERITNGRKINKPSQNDTIQALLNGAELADGNKFKVDGKPIADLCELTPGTASDGKQPQALGQQK